MALVTVVSGVLSGKVVSGVLSVPVGSCMVPGTVVSGREETGSEVSYPQATTNINAAVKETRVLKRYIKLAAISSIAPSIVDLPGSLLAVAGCHRVCRGLSKVAVAWATATGPGRA